MIIGMTTKQRVGVVILWIVGVRFREYDHGGVHVVQATLPRWMRHWRS
jgi:hypothetical protein